jgi:hypothetical protein
VSLLILIIAFMLVRRRKARRATETIGADIIVTGPMGAWAAKKQRGEKDKAKFNYVESSSSSINSEPLPLYEMNKTRKVSWVGW